MITQNQEKVIELKETHKKSGTINAWETQSCGEA